MNTQFEKLVEIIRVLRSENGCEWDREQTHRTLRPNMIEEAYEAVDAIDEGSPAHLQEELGDVLLQVLLHSQIAAEEGAFDIENVAKTLCDKLIHRHPHVFGNVQVKDSNEIIANWEKLKKEEKPERKSVLDGISHTMPSLMTTQKISKRAVKTGFEWPNEKALYECIFSEIEEFRNAETQEEKEDELGDILFAVVNLARWNNIDSESALLHANKKFTERFNKMEELAQKPLEQYSFSEFDALWKQAKKSLR